MHASRHPPKHFSKGYLNPRQTILATIWKRVSRYSFIMPAAICSHTDAWDILDIDIACCRLCGAAHACRQEQCPVAESDEGYQVCTITAFVIRAISFSKEEYVDTAIVPLTHTSTPCMWSDNVETTVRSCCIQLLTGADWERCVNHERNRTTHKKKLALVKYLKAYKKNNPKKLPNIYQAACHVTNCTTRMRIISTIDTKSRLDLASWCSATLCKHIHLLNSMGNGYITESKLRPVAIGLLYLLRSGITMHGIVLLPKCTILCNILPLETQLDTVFKTRSKVITETENLVKTIFRCATVDALMDYGVHSIDVRLNLQ